MQKKIIALAIAGLASTAAFAQTNVTIYGVADVGYAHVHNGGSKPQNVIDSGLLSGSRIGFKGVEDLGNGLKALFTLEYAIAVDENAPVGFSDAPWSGTTARQQFVGLTSNYGTVVAGRLQTAGYDFACAYNPLAGGALDTTAKLGSSTVLQCGTGGRRDNAVAYISPSFAGLTLALNHARLTEARNGANPDEKDSSATLVGLTYANGPIAATGLFSKAYTTNDGISGAGRNDITEYGLGASYDAKIVKVFATFQTNKVEALSSATVADKSDRKWQLGVSVPVTSAGTVLASYARNSMRSTVASDDNSWSLGLAYVHALSKRTKLYAGYNYLSNDNAANRGVVGGTTDLGGFATTLGAGINHSF